MEQGSAAGFWYVIMMLVIVSKWFVSMFVAHKDNMVWGETVNLLVELPDTCCLYLLWREDAADVFGI